MPSHAPDVAVDPRHRAAALRSKLMGIPDQGRQSAPVHLWRTIYPAPIGPIRPRRTAMTAAERAREVVRRVAMDEGVTYGDIMGPRRQKEYVAARWLAMWIVAKANPRWSLPQIGDFFNGRDHSTVHHALRCMAAIFDGKPYRRPSIPKNSTWTPERVQTLIAMRAEGVSFEKIGRAIGLSKGPVREKMRRIQSGGGNA